MKPVGLKSNVICGELTCTDEFCTWECKEQQVFILHLFSTFLWATAHYLSVSQFHPTAVTYNHEGYVHYRLMHARLESDKIETLVQELQSIELGTSEEIYRVLIPPLSHFNLLPNEAVADWWNERLIEREVSLCWKDTFRGYCDLLQTVECRGAQDRFAKRATAIFVEFFLRVNEAPSPFPYGEEYNLDRFVEGLGSFINKKYIFKAILSLEDILARRWDLPRNDRTTLVLRKLGVENVLGQTQCQELLKEFYPPDHTLREDDFSFTHETDVFGWTRNYWRQFNGIYEVKYHGMYIEYKLRGYMTLDLAGQSVLHHVMDSIRDSGFSEDRVGKFCDVWPTYFTKALEDSKVFTARCNKQTPLHRAARVGHVRVMVDLLDLGADPNAADHFGRSALCLAAHHGNFEVVNVLFDKMTPIGRDRTDNNARNALHYAILNQNEEAALSLIERGIDINVLDHFGRPPVLYAAMNHMERVVES